MTIINFYALNGVTPIFINQTLLDLIAQIDPQHSDSGDNNTPLSPIDRSSRQKINFRIK
jgi:hypothetical protein